MLRGFRLRFVVVALVASSTSACTRNAGRRDLLIQRASFDFECPPDQLTLTALGTIPTSMGVIGSYGVTGCNQRATYVLNSGVWVLNSRGGELEEASP